MSVQPQLMWSERQVREILGVTSGRTVDKETWEWNDEVQKYVQRKRLAKKKWGTERTEESRPEYREMQRKVKVRLVKAKQKVYDDLYARLDNKED